MTTTASLESMQRSIWQARLPLEIRLDPSECRIFDKADAYLIAWPRISYLPSLLPRLHAYFRHFFISDPESVPIEDGYFTYDGVPLKWHLPLGLIYDMYVMAVRDNSSEQGSTGRIVPFRLTLRYVHDKASSNVNMINPDPTAMHDSFINSVKEADFLRSGTARPIMSLPTADSKALWSSTQENDLQTFGKIFRSLLPTAGQIRNMPLRLYLPSASEDAPAMAQMKVLQSPVAPMAIGVSISTVMQARAANLLQAQTLGTALHALLPGLFPSRRTPILARPILHGTQVPLNAHLEDLARWGCYADGWLSIVVSIDS